MNPYYLAWLKTGGICKPLYLFSLWIQQKHREFKAIHQIDNTGYSYKYKNYTGSWYETEFNKYILMGPHQKITHER